MSDPRHKWNVIYNARSNRHHPPTSVTAPARQNCTPKSKRNLPKTVEASLTVRGRFEHDHDPNPIRAWNCKTEPARWPRLLFPPQRRILYWKVQHFALRLSIQISPHTAPATKSDTPRSPDTARHEKWHCNMTLHDHWAAEVLLYWTVTLLSCFFAELLLYWAGTELTELSCYLLYWAVTLLSCCFTELLPYSAFTLLSCYFTEMWWICRAVTLLSCYFTELLSCHCTELLLCWAVALLSCYFTELLLYWAATLLNCYFTDLLLYWAVTLMSCDFTELWLYCYFTAFLNLCNSEVSQLNFLW